jgi:hypothetical protein
LVQLSNPTRSETIDFCPGEVVTIGGVDYSQSGTVIDTLPGTGCDTIVTYTLVQLSNPTRAETIEFCPGESIVLGGQTYTQPGTVTLVHPANTGCDTIVTYTLRSLLPAPSVVDIDCPAQISVIAQPGEAPLQIQYNLPVATSDCPCPGVALTLTSGLPSGGLFPNGTTQVCYTAKDSCGNSASCCFVVTVREIQPCDIKMNGCMRYELLSITADVAQNKTYRIRVINNCPNELIYTAIQLPDQVVAMEPAHLSVYTADSGREYDVRNPNFSPFYSIRYKSTSDSISNGQSDVFQYTLPAQSAPLYMNITSRLFPQLFYEAHLNTFNCPIGVTPTGNRTEVLATAVSGLDAGVRLFPNPTDGALWIERSGATGEETWRVFNSQGQEVMRENVAAATTGWRIDLPATLPTGLYFFQLGDGQQKAVPFVLQR